MRLAGVVLLKLLLVEPEDSSDHTSCIIQHEKVLVVFLDVRSHGAGHDNLAHEVEVTEHKEDLAILLVIFAHSLLVGKEVELVYVSFGILRCIRRGRHVEVRLEVPVSIREDVVLNLNDRQREVDFCYLKV